MCCQVLRRCGISQNSNVYKLVEKFFPGRCNFFSNPKSLSLERVLLACKKLLPSEQVFLIKKFCLSVAEIAKCSNYGFEIKRKSRSNAKKRQSLLAPLLRKPNLPFKREKLNIRKKCGDGLQFIKSFLNISQFRQHLSRSFSLEKLARGVTTFYGKLKRSPEKTFLGSEKSCGF